MQVDCHLQKFHAYYLKNKNKKKMALNAAQKELKLSRTYFELLKRSEIYMIKTQPKCLRT